MAPGCTRRPPASWSSCAGRDHAPWGRFVRLYYPLIYHRARRAGASVDGAADLVQEALVILIRAMPGFEYDPARSFRSWLRTVALNAWRSRRRAPAAVGDGLDDVPGPGTPPGEAFEEAEYRRRPVGRAVRLMRADFQPTTWRACWATVVEERPAAEVAAELGITVNSVYLAKSRVLRRLHQELDGLLD